MSLQTRIDIVGKTSFTLFLCLYWQVWTNFSFQSSVFIVDFGFFFLITFQLKESNRNMALNVGLHQLATSLHSLPDFFHTTVEFFYLIDFFIWIRFCIDNRKISEDSQLYITKTTEIRFFDVLLFWRNFFHILNLESHCDIIATSSYRILFFLEIILKIFIICIFFLTRMFLGILLVRR